jgi:hypothetical protein
MTKKMAPQASEQNTSMKRYVFQSGHFSARRRSRLRTGACTVAEEGVEVEVGVGMYFGYRLTLSQTQDNVVSSPRIEFPQQILNNSLINLNCACAHGDKG